MGNLSAQEVPSDSGAARKQHLFASARELRQLVTQAKAVQEEQYSDAVRALTRSSIRREATVFLLATGKSELRKPEVEAWDLGSMPLRGRQLYELECGHDAKAAAMPP
jgi:hypothetical protein